jgi:hypothetical protein
MLMLSTELSNENSPLHVRNAAGLALKNALTARVSNHAINGVMCSYTSTVVGDRTAK